MKRKAHSASVLGGVLIAIILIACSISGLAAGVYARHLSEPLAAGNTATSGSIASASHTPRPAPSATPIPTATARTIAQQPGNLPFFLAASASPASLAAGQTLTITIQASSQYGSAPVVGLTCYMRAPSDGRVPLFQTWPTPAVTGASGQATWTLTAPQVAPGPYGVEVVAYGANHFTYYSDAFITITG